MTAKKTTKTEAVADAAGAADTTTDSKPSDAQADEPKRVKGQIVVSTAKGVDRFFRAGRGFGPVPTVIEVSELAEGDLERLLAEPRLTVVEGDAKK